MLRVARNSFFGRSPDGMLEPSWTGSPVQSPHLEGSFQVSLSGMYSKNHSCLHLIGGTNMDRASTDGIYDKACCRDMLFKGSMPDNLSPHCRPAVKCLVSLHQSWCLLLPANGD